MHHVKPIGALSRIRLSGWGGQQAHMFLRSAGLPSESWMLYIFPYIESTQGGRGRGMGNKSDKVVPSLCFSLSRIYSQRPCWPRLPFALLCLPPFFFFLTYNSASVCLFPLHCAGSHRGHSRTAQLRNNSPDVVVAGALWLGSVRTQSRITRRVAQFRSCLIHLDGRHCHNFFEKK